MSDLELLRLSLPVLARGAVLTLQLTALVLLLGLVLAIPLALARSARLAAPRAFADIYIEAFRATPALVQVFLLYYGARQFEVVRESALWAVLREPFWCTVIALSLNSAACTARILANALSDVPLSLLEVARSLGLSRSARFRTVTLSLAVRAALPAYRNEAVLACKTTSLASTVTLMELTGSARLLASRSEPSCEALIAAGIGYLLISGLLTALLHRVECALAWPRVNGRMSEQTSATNERVNERTRD